MAKGYEKEPEEDIKNNSFKRTNMIRILMNWQYYTMQGN